MKKKLSLILMLILSITITTSIAIASNFSTKKGKEAAYQEQQKVKEFFIKQAEAKKNKVLTDEQKEHLRKLNVIRDDVFKDICNSFDLDEMAYLKLEFSDLNIFFSGKMEGFEDQAFLKSIQPFINDGLQSVTLGATKPFVLIKKDKSEVLVTYKNASNDNLIYKLKFDSTDFQRTIETRKGKEKLKIEDVK